jgi:hypothetical protein
VAALLITLFGPLLAAAELPVVGRIVVFGDMDLEASVRAKFPAPPFAIGEKDAETFRKLLIASPLWRESDFTWVCCEPAGTAILYVGVKRNKNVRTLRTPPTGRIRLPTEDLALYERLMDLNHEAVTKGHSGPEDDSAGHALSSYPAIRAAQDAVLERAGRQSSHWRRVALEADDRLHRAAAVHLIPYGPKDAALGQILTTAAEDPEALVRNNALRAIGVLARSQPGRSLVRFEPRPLLQLFESIHWTDWNKASFLLMALTDADDPELLAKIAAHAAEPLRQIARWPAMHAQPAEVVLDRIARVSGLKR